MTILITGATSAVGYFIAKRVVEEENDEKIKILIRSKKPPEHLAKVGLDFVKGDLTNKKSLVKALQGVNTIYNAAGEARENIPAKLYYDVNHIGTRNLLESFVENKGEKFLHVSTVGIYGYKLPSFPITEDYPKKSDHPYHESKWLAEQELFRFSDDYDFFATAVRPPYIVGPRDRQMAPKLFDFLLKDKKIPLIGNGKATLSFVHHEDVADALIKCGKTPAANREAFNIVGGTITARELFESIGDICGKVPNFMRINYGLAYTIGLVSELAAKI
ncbi:MAG: NAD-dependent epimerase/dehydratase family protein, partial [Candidatus Heimdallarchaeota archaeon]|nr:NAD-dependent epimerase/dehydratase family protein [Candidatus Heimdallarchaeota archaeon]MCK4876087.1 NAD-dependent epimerase/dehydratase family protein [Candidatus Heimdallarchaeota archaeon]